MYCVTNVVVIPLIKDGVDDSNSPAKIVDKYAVIMDAIDFQLVSPFHVSSGSSVLVNDVDDGAFGGNRGGGEEGGG